MMHGVACVGTRVGGVPEVVEDGVTGILVPPESPTALAEAISRIIADPALRTRLGAAGLEAYRSRFTDSVMAEMIETEYSSLVHNSRGRESRS